MILILRGLNSKTFWCKIFSTCVCYLKIKYIYDALKVSHLHLDIEDSSFLLNPLLYGGHGLVEHRQTLCALQSRGGHDISRWCDQIYLKKKTTLFLLQNLQIMKLILKHTGELKGGTAHLDRHGLCGAVKSRPQSVFNSINAFISITRHLNVCKREHYSKTYMNVYINGDQNSFVFSSFNFVAFKKTP